MNRGLLTSSIACLAFASVAFGQSESPVGVTITDLNFVGNGCPEGSVSHNISVDGKALTLLFDSWVADTSTTNAASVRKNCAVNLKVNAPAGWRYTIFNMSTRGYAQLEPGVTARIATAFRFPGSANGVLVPLDMAGPYADNYTLSTGADLQNIPWSNCAGPSMMQISADTEVRVAPASTSVPVRLSSLVGQSSVKDMPDMVLGMRVTQQYSNVACVKDQTFGFRQRTVWVANGCSADFEVSLRANQSSAPRQNGILTVDSIDGEFTQKFGIAWQRCGAGRWVQADTALGCAMVCANAGLRSARDVGGAICASGVARPASAIGSIQFVEGCNGVCKSMGKITTNETNAFCLAPGQRMTGAPAERTVGCFCN